MAKSAKSISLEVNVEDRSVIRHTICALWHILIALLVLRYEDRKPGRTVMPKTSHDDEAEKSYNVQPKSER